MPSDRARDSYDPTRQYRSVVMQQGRVTLEADGNEAQFIAAENLRLETIDIVGPCGTPDDGYAVSGAGFLGLSIGPGTMYVGGERVELPEAVEYAKQSEWLDSAGDPLWIDQKGMKLGTEFVYLLLREQEVGAVEDVPLREVALGGPDTAQRTRLTQRFVRAGVEAKDCETALTAVEKQWQQLGLQFDDKSMRLNSPATLQVKFVQQPVAESPCDPQVQGGYLGADNQLIRVQITGFDAKTKSGRFVWSYNNASFLYRVNRIDNQTIELVAAPIDSYHEPRVGNAVEILRSAVDLKDGNFVAAPSGFITTPAQAYVPETRRLALTDALPAVDQNPIGPLFLRLWETEVTFNSGVPQDLAGTGLQVIIDLDGSPGALTVGQFWYFAVRPSTPVNLYPQRYLDAPQPPEGPRMWACPLATISWATEKFQLLDDCREKFDNLVELTKRHTACCSIVVSPADVDGGTGLSKLLDSVRGQKATVSLKPGQYQLIEPLVLTKEHDGLTLEGCHDGAVLTAMSGHEAKFAQGLVVLNAVANCTLRLLRFHLPLTPASKQRPAISIGVQVSQCADLHVEECLFRFVLAPDLSVRAVGIHAISDCWNMRLERNRFLHDAQYKREKPLERLLVGFAVTPASLLTKAGGRGASDFLPALLENTSIVGNEFAGLTMAVYVRAEFGRMRCDNNFVRECDGGFYFTNTRIELLREALLVAFRDRARSPANEAVFTDLMHVAQAQVVGLMHDLTMHTVLPADLTVHETVKIGQGPHGDETKKIRADARNANLQLVESRSAADVTTKAKKEPDPADPAKAAAPAPAGEISAEKIRQATGAFLVRFPEDASSTQRVPALRFTGNDVEIVSNAQRSKRDLAAAAMVGLWAVVDGKSDGSALVTSNDIRGSGDLPIAVILQQRIVVVTGNLILNSLRAGGSLFALIERNGLMNVSGNVLEGASVISPAPRTSGVNPPPQPLKDGVGDWRVLNSMRP